MKLTILAFGTHPDDVELFCGGTILCHVALGKKVGIVDLTKGELSSRGNPEIRAKEARQAAKLLGLQVRENLGFADGFFKNDKEHQLAVIRVIRKYQPEIVLAPAIKDRHPDHPRAAQLVADGCFLSGLPKIATTSGKKPQKSWRPKLIFHYIQDRYIAPDLVIDITPYMEKKQEVIKAYKSQFYDPDSKEPETYISTPRFLEFITARARSFGHSIGVQYGEGFTSARQIGMKDLGDLI